MTLLNLDKDITFEMARAATIKALEMPNTPASAASLRGLRPAISAIKREAPSELICIARNGILLLYPDFTHRVMYNKKKSPDLYEHAKVGCPHTLHVHTRSMCTHAGSSFERPWEGPLVGDFGGGDYVCSPPSPTRTTHACPHTLTARTRPTARTRSHSMPIACPSHGLPISRLLCVCPLHRPTRSRSATCSSTHHQASCWPAMICTCTPSTRPWRMGRCRPSPTRSGMCFGTTSRASCRRAARVRQHSTSSRLSSWL